MKSLKQYILEDFKISAHTDTRKNVLDKKITSKKEKEQEQKMDMWATGKRGFNIKAASDEKLKINYGICKRKGYGNLCKQLKAEADRRHIKID